MPLCKYIIQTRKTDINKAAFGTLENKNEYDDCAVANQRMVNAMRHLSQLIKIADDIFGAIEIECRSVYERTTELNTKIQHCREIVDNLNAKTVKVPVSSLSESQATHLHFKSCDAEKIDKVSVFSRFPRPPAVDKLRDLAHGPSPPVVIPCGMVASEVDGYIGTISSSNSSTHIYCKPVKIKDANKPRTSVDSGDSNGHNKNMTSSVKVPSSVVAIDVSGQPFSRMASFRRSLIHVDFLIRRKRKKDKRRNTVAEGDVKELKDALQKIVNDECQFTIPNSICSYQHIIAESKNAYNTQVHENRIDRISAEKNNNAANVKSIKQPSCINSVENQIIVDDKGKNNALNGDGHGELKVNETENVTRHSSSKRKPKSNIPISTISAAMNVAVEMRQRNGITTETSVLNGICNNSDQNSSDSDNKQQDNRNSNSSSYNEGGSQEESWTSYKKRLQEKCRSFTNNRKGFNENNMVNKEVEVSSSASSENIGPQDNTTNVTTSVESDTFFISSDESDEESSDVVYFQENYGSSTSLGTASDGSLNSLLSETGTEMTSSTGTLTSVGREHLLTPPPPPPPMILSATVKDKDIVENVSAAECFGYDTEAVSKKSLKAESVSQKQTKQTKSTKPSKPMKSDLFDLQRNLTENSKNIFTSLVSLKTHSKDKSKSKHKIIEKKKLNKNPHQPAFDMYGNNSPTKAKQMPTFIKENISPVIQNEGKNHMKSFFVNDMSRNSVQLSDSENTNKSLKNKKSDSIPNRNIPCNTSPNSSDVTKVKEIQTMSVIPPKYEHQVIVTPVQRCTELENKNTYHKGSFETDNQQNLRYGNISRPSSVNTESQIYAPRIHRPHPPVTLQQERSKAARVVLDFDGKVIYSTNSLDRKHYNTGHNVNIYNSVQNAVWDQHFKDTKFADNSYYNACQENHQRQISQVSPAASYNSNAVYPLENAIMYSSPNVSFNRYIKSRSDDEQNMKNESYINQTHQQFPTFNMQTFVPKRMDTRPYSFAGNSSDTYLSSPSNNLIPDPNISGLPVQENMLTRHNVSLHSKQMEQMNMNTPEDSYKRISSAYCMSPPSQTNSGNLLNKSPQSTMSTEDLFAVIHDCKKRMNIKTDSDISLASSSRSSSPSYLRPSSSKSTLVETGFLSPRSQIHLETSGDRRSWADFRPVESICSERKSLASDRLGPTKPTSMHDFKMLLLQARTSSQISGPRKSAVEMLKVPLNQNNRNPIPPFSLNLSPRSSISMSVQNSPTAELNLHNGHSTVPFKRGNRIRASLQPRCIMYPPIFEDCSEDSENCGDIISNKPITSAGIESKNGKENPEWKQNSDRDKLETS